MATKEKSFLSKNKMYWEYGDKIREYDPKIALCVKNFCVNKIFAVFKKNGEILNESERKEFEMMIKKLIDEKKQLCEQANYTVDDYSSFTVSKFINFYIYLI